MIDDFDGSGALLRRMRARPYETVDEQRVGGAVIGAGHMGPNPEVDADRREDGAAPRRTSYGAGADTNHQLAGGFALGATQHLLEEGR